MGNIARMLTEVNEVFMCAGAYKTLSYFINAKLILLYFRLPDRDGLFAGQYSLQNIFVIDIQNFVFYKTYV